MRTCIQCIHPVTRVLHKYIRVYLGTHVVWYIKIQNKKKGFSFSGLLDCLSHSHSTVTTFNSLSSLVELASSHSTSLNPYFGTNFFLLTSNTKKGPVFSLKYTFSTMLKYHPLAELKYNPLSSCFSNPFGTVKSVHNMYRKKKKRTQQIRHAMHRCPRWAGTKIH